MSERELQMWFHFGERDRAGDGKGPLDAAVMDACARHGVWAAALLRGVEGFGAKHLERTDRLLSLSEDAPLVAVAVGEGDAIERLAEEVRTVAAGGLLTVEEVDAGLATTGTPTTTAAGVGVPVVGSLEDRVGDAVRATVWGPRTGTQSPHLRVVDALWRHGAESATVLLGVEGVLDGERRRARFVASNRGVPAITVTVGERGAILAALAEVGGLANLVTFEGVEPFCRMKTEKLHGDDGVERNRRHATERLRGTPGVERSSRIAGGKLHGEVGTRVVLVTSEAAQHDGRPRYLALIHALRRAGAPGATALRGVWGFRGEVAPHGDRVLALRRDVPVIVETVDSAERFSRWLAIAESLAGEADVVYSQGGLRILTLD